MVHNLIVFAGGLVLGLLSSFIKSFIQDLGKNTINNLIQRKKNNKTNKDIKFVCEQMASSGDKFFNFEDIHKALNKIKKNNTNSYSKFILGVMLDRRILIKAGSMYIINKNKM